MKRFELSVRAVIGVVGLTAGLAQAQGQRPVFQPPATEVSFAPITVCFAEGTDPRYVARVTNMTNMLNRLRFGDQDYQLTGRWSGAQGTPRALLWSFVPDNLSIPGSNGEPTAPSTLFATFDSGYSGQGGRATWVNRFVQVFARWQAISGLTYTRVTVGGNDWDDGAAWGSGGAAGARGDVRICAHPIDGASGILAYNQFPSNGDMVLDSNDIGNFAQASNANRFLRNVVAHEHGHGMGLLHVCPANATKLMEPFISTAYDGPQQDDIRAAQRHYGDPYEINDTAAAAKPLGALAIPGNISFGTLPAPVAGSSDPNAALLSIDADGETDFWSFTVAASASVTVTATPVGSNYLQAAQDANCNTGTAVNALAQANLVVSIIGSDGTTVLGTSNTQAVGVAETLSNVICPTAGTYYVRITEADSPSQSQLYRLNLSAVTGVVVCPQFTQQPPAQTEVCQGSNVQFTVAVSGAPTPTLQWRRNNVDIPGQTSSTLNISLVTPGLSAGTYTCVATNGCPSGPVTSSPAVLTVDTGISIDTQPNPNQVVNAGSPVSFTVDVSGSPLPSFQWRKNNANISGANAATYTILSTVPGDTGNYDCVLTNPCDEQTTEVAHLTVNGAAPCYANCDGSTTSPVLTANDFQCFLNNYAANLPSANCDGSTTSPTLTANDFQCFLNLFAAGCS